MLKQFVTVLPGVLGPSLVVMVYHVLLSVGHDRDKPASASLRSVGLAVGFIAAVIFAALRATAVINRRTMVNYPTLVACVVVDLLAIGLVLYASRLTEDWHRHTLELNLANALAGFSIALIVFRALPDVILRLTSFVEPGSPFFTSDMLLRVLGFVLGFGAAIIIALIFGTMRTTCPRSMFTLAALLLMVLVLVQHATALFAIMQNVGDLVLHGAAFRLLIMFFNAATWVEIAQGWVFAIPAVASMIVGFRTPLAGVDTAQVRKHIAFRRKARIVSVASLVAMVCITVALTYGKAQTNKTPVLSSPEAYSLTSQRAVIKFARVSDGHLHRFQYKAKDGTVMRFIIIKKNGGAYGIGLDACENCGDAGYYEKDGKIICKKCDVAINLATIGFKGGCNPIPFKYTTSQGKIIIQTSDLDALSSHFKS